MSSKSATARNTRPATRGVARDGTTEKAHADSDRARLLQRLEELELRVKLLEARVRSTLSKAGQVTGEGAEGAERRKGEQGGKSRPRPRCPGCTLELPKGKRGDSCVWCGFQFDAVGDTFR